MTALRVADPPGRQHVEPARSRPPVVNLLDDLEGLGDRLSEAIASADWLDSFLVAAGMNQVTEDYLHRDVFMLERASSNLERVNPQVGRVARAAQRLALLAREFSPREKKVRAWQRTLAETVDSLARLVVGDEGRTPVDVLPDLTSLPGKLRRAILRMPTCFQSLDQDPSDCVRLAARFQGRWPDRTRAVRVLGLRTSGSYLAPLVAASLRAAGYLDVKAWTVRPTDRLYRAERGRLESLLGSDAMLVLVDDPPKSGSSLVRAVEWLERRGLSRDRIVMLVPLTGSADVLPRALGGYSTVVLPFGEWTVSTRLRDDSIRETLTDLLADKVVAVRRLSAPAMSDLKSGSPVRRHVRAVFEVEIEDGFGRRFQRHVYAKGVGAGYFGRHSLTVANALAGFVPETYGLRDGLLFRQWIPEASRVRTMDHTPDALGAIADYVQARRAKLAVGADVSERMAGLNPVWQRVADLLALAFGRARPLLRPLTHAVARRMLHVDRPSVIDGSMALGHWFRTPGEKPGLVKVDYDERAYSNQDTVVDQLYSFDAVYDLASAAADLQLADAHEDAVALRQRFEVVAGPIADERWFLYQLIALKSYRQFLDAMRREAADGSVTELPAEIVGLLESPALALELERARDAMSRVDQQYWRRLMFEELAPSLAGPVCAIDVDGVLETGHLGYSSVTEAGAMALRSLLAHGYRPILVTGRSAGDVRDRCRSFGLPGGVAEYGAALYTARDDTVHDLRRAAELQDLEHLRSGLASAGEVHIHAGYRHAVRASLVTATGPRPLPDGMVRERLESLGLAGRVRIIQGWLQTDFMAAGIDKGTGLHALLIELGERDHHIALAVGDSPEDLPVMKMAALAIGPRNADPSLAAAGARVMSGSHQAGLAAAVGLVIGHRPGGCDLCRPGALSRDAELLLTALGAQQEGRTVKVRQALRLAVQVAGTR